MTSRSGRPKNYFLGPGLGRGEGRQFIRPPKGVFIVSPVRATLSRST